MGIKPQRPAFLDIGMLSPIPSTLQVGRRRVYDRIADILDLFHAGPMIQNI